MMHKKLTSARRMQDIQPFHVMDLLARAKAMEEQGRWVIHMEIGEPDFPTPQPIVEAGIQALNEGKTHYTSALGLTALREVIAHSYNDRYGLDVSPHRIVITPGASGALQLVLGILINPGDHLLMADPGYPCNRHFVRLFEGEALSVAVGSVTDYQLTAQLVNQNWSNACIGAMLATPSNPTGTIIPQQELKAIADTVRAKHGALIVDEIYHGLTYDEAAVSALTVYDEAFIINSFSKYYGMTGWRLGWIVAPEPYVKQLDILAQNLFLAAPTPAQYAALAAFTSQTLEILEQRREEFRQRRDFLLPALRDIGFDIPVTPQGAFYLYANSKRFGEDSFGLCERVLEDAGVAFTPGIDFGNNNAKQHVRFAYTTSLANLEEGVQRLSHSLR